MENNEASTAPDLRLVGPIPRCPGFRYAPKLVSLPYCGAYLFWVEQKGFWMDASIVGPSKLTPAEAVKAWKRLLNAKYNKPISLEKHNDH